MALKSIVCLLNGFDHELSAVEAALALARENGARLRILHVSYPVYSYSGFFGEAVMVGGGWAEAFEEAARARQVEARKLASSAAAAAGIPLDAPSAPGGASATFAVIENRTNAAIVREMSLCDLLVVGAQKGAADISDDSVTGLALFSSGRPLLVVRPRPEGAEPAWSGRTCALAWNHSAEAIRSVLSARDILAAADRVHVFVAGAPKRPLDAHENQLVMDYLGAHGIAAEIEAVDQAGLGDAEAVLEAVRRVKADVLVMGAYGHSVFRELLLGGFTAHMLEEAEVSLLLAH